MNKETILSYLEEIKQKLIVGRVVEGYERLEFVMYEMKADIHMEKKHSLDKKDERKWEVRKCVACRDSYFNGIMCLENDTQYGFFKDSNDMRPSSCTWIDADKVEHLFKLFALQKENE